MVLDVKALTWAGRNGIDTAKLKAAKVPIYGKWYFPEIPANIPLVNLETGERRTFPARMVAGEVMWVAERDLRRAGLGDLPPAEPEPAPAAASPAEAPTAPVQAVEPLIAMNRVPFEVEGEEAHPVAAPEETALAIPAPAIEEGLEPGAMHMPLPSIAPLLLAVGISIVLLGVITSLWLSLVGLVWAIIGAIGWVRIGLLELPVGDHSAHG